MAESNATTQDPKLVDADEHLKKLEADLAVEDSGVVQSTDAGETNRPADRPAEVEGKEEAAPDSKPEQTPEEAQEIKTANAEAAKEGKELVLDNGKPKRDAEGKFVRQDKKPDEPAVALSDDEKKKFSAYLKQTQSKYGADLGKRLVRWDAIKTEEARVNALAGEKQKQLDAAIQKFNTDYAQFQQQRQSSTPTPEAYETFSQKCADRATVKEAEAITAENNGDTEKAEALRKEAWVLNEDARRAKASADHVRKNPPPDAKQVQEKFTKDQQSWVGKAATDFPEFGKKDSEVQKTTAKVFKAITTQHPEAARLPGVIYYCARIAAAEAAAEAAAKRVPVMEKELGELRAKVKELDVLTNPVAGGNIHKKAAESPQTEEQELAELQQMAAGLR